MKQKIIEMYYNEHLMQKEISERLKVSKSFVSQVIKKDPRYKEYKEQKLLKSKEKHNKEIQKRVEKKRKEKQLKNSIDVLVLKKIHEQDSLELSQRSHLSNENYRKWNNSAYKYNPSKKRYEFDETLGRSYDVPKFIKER